MLDSSTGKPLSLATVALYNSIDSALIMYVITDANGKFSVSPIPINTACYIIISHEGYDMCKRKLFFNELTKIDFGNINMVPASKNLQEVIVQSEIPPVVFRKDTIEFNASSFKTLPNALVEDLLKKLPGMLVDASGNITYNGSSISKIYVDGKNFFNDNYKAATTILPSEIVKKVQVYDDKERFEGIGDERLNKVINLTLKQEVKRSTFGKLSASGGTSGRNELAGVSNFMRDTIQLTIVGYKNNLNKGIFNSSEIKQLGAFNRSSYSMTDKGDGNYSYNGISFGGGSTAETISNGGGINFNHAPTKSLSLFAQYFTSNENGFTNRSNIQFLFNTDSFSKVASTSSLNANELRHNANVGLRYSKGDSVVNIYMMFNIFFTSNLNNSINFSNNLSSNNKYDTLNNTIGNNVFETDSKNLFSNFSFFKSKKRKNKLLQSYTVGYNFNSFTKKSDIRSDFDYLLYVPTFNNQLVRQLRVFDQKGFNVNFNVRFSHWVSKKIMLAVNSDIGIEKVQPLINTLIPKVNSSNSDSLVANLSSHLQANSYQWKTSPSILFKLKKLDIRTAINFWQIAQEVNFSNSTYENYIKSYFKPLVSGSIDYNKFSATFTQFLKQPDIRSLSPIADISNPVIIYIGNTNLIPELKQELNLYSSKHINTKEKTFYFNLLVSNTKNIIIQTVKVRNDGIQIVRPINADNEFDFTFRLNIDKALKKLNRFNHRFSIGYSFNYNERPFLYNDLRGRQYVSSVSAFTSTSISWEDRVDIMARYGISIGENKYSNNFQQKIRFISQNISSEFKYRFSKSISFETDLQLNTIHYEDFAAIPTNIFWNTSIGYSFLKKQQFQVRLACRDLLNRNNNFSVVVNGNRVTENYTNVLGRYFLFTVSYNFKSFSNNNGKKLTF